MLTKNDLRDAILKECDIALHLHGKIPEGGMEYRPTPGQRNTLELLRYIAMCGIAGARAMAEGGWDGYQEEARRTAEMAPEDFPAAIAEQKNRVTGFFDALSDEDLVERKATSPLGDEMSLGHALFELPVKWMIGYRMQLYLYCKQAGNEEIWTPDCWAGIDREKPQP